MQKIVRQYYAKDRKTVKWERFYNNKIYAMTENNKPVSFKDCKKI